MGGDCLRGSGWVEVCKGREVGKEGATVTAQTTKIGRKKKAFRGPASAFQGPGTKFHPEVHGLPWWAPSISLPSDFHILSFYMCVYFRKLP